MHRLVYFGYLFGVFHFLTINPVLLLNPAGYLLLGITVLALAGELFWFLKMIKSGKATKFGTLVGIVVILLWILLGWLAFG